MKKLLMITTAFVAVVVGGIVYYQHTRSPEYSLWKAQEAFKQHDLATFEKYVDVEGIINRLIAQLFEMRDTTGDLEDEWEQLGHALGEGLATLLKPQLTTILRQQVSDLIERGDFEADIEKKPSEEAEFSLLELWYGPNHTKMTFEGIEYIKKEGKIAYAGLKFKAETQDEPQIVILKMRDLGDYWQVAELNNFFELLNQFEPPKHALLGIVFWFSVKWSFPFSK